MKLWPPDGRLLKEYSPAVTMWSQLGLPGHPFFHVPCSHNQRSTTFRHPVTGQISPENVDYVLQEPPGSRMSRLQPDPRPSSMVSESTTVTSSAADASSGPKGSRTGGKVHSFGKRDQAIKRNPNVPVVVRGWLYKQDSSGMRLWKRKWFVLSDFCLFYYKDSREETVLGSIPLPSYVIAPVGPSDHISRKYAFKASHTGMRSYIYNKSSVIGWQAEHSGMRTYFFSADTQEDMNGWIRALTQAALLQSHGTKRESEKSERQAVPQSNHVNSQRKSPSQPGHLDQSEKAARLDEDTHKGREDDTRFGFEKREETHAGRGDDTRFGFEKHEETHAGQRDDGTFGFEKREETRKEREDEERYGFRRDAGTETQGRSKSPAGVVEMELRSHRNGLPPTSAPPEQNGSVAYKRVPVPHTDTKKQVQRKTTLAQVENWVKVQKGDPESLPASEHTLPRQTPPTQPKASTMDTYQSLPKTPRHSSSGTPPPVPRNLPSDYKYAHDRLSHFRMSTDERVATKEGTVWQLYEWQQRQQFRHGSPTVPIYASVGGPDYVDSSAFRVTLEVPRSISVPPLPSDIPPPGPPSRGVSPRRPHTPADRVTVLPRDERPTPEVPASGSPRRVRSQLSQTAQMGRRSVPPMGYITHTVSAPSLHGKTPEELTLLLIQLRRHQAKMAGVRNNTLAHLQRQNALSCHSLQADDAYTQLKKDLEYLDLKVTGRETLKERSGKPVKIAESDVDVKLSRLCEQDKFLQELEGRIRTLKEDKDKLESVLDVSHQQMEQYRDQPAHVEKIAYQQRLLQEDVVQIRAEISRISTEMENAWDEYSRLEKDLDLLKKALQDQMNRNILSQQEKAQMRKELWRMEDVLAGLSSSKANYKVTIDSVKNPERKLVPSVSLPSVPSLSVSSTSAGDAKPLCHSPAPEIRPSQHPVQQPAWAPHKPVPKGAEEDAPPRPPLPQIYSPEDHPPAVPPLPKEASVIRHTSVRGLKRQSDERKRDREVGQYANGDYKVELRSYQSEPELLGVAGPGQTGAGAPGPCSGYQTLPSRGLAGSTSRLHQSSDISSYVTLRRGGAGVPGLKERPKSALERLYSGEWGGPPRGRVSAEEQLERMKRHQKALVRERKRTLSQGERAPSSASPRPLSADLGSWRREQEFDLQLLERAVQGEEQPSEHGERARSRSDEWLTVHARPARELDLEPLDYDLDLSRELSKPQKVSIPERYVDLEPEEPLSQQELEARYRKVARIRSILAKSRYQLTSETRNSTTHFQSMQPPQALNHTDFADLDLALQEQERIITMSYALASEASQKSKQVAVPRQVPPPPLSNGFHYTFV